MRFIRESFRFLRSDRWLSEEAKSQLFPRSSQCKVWAAAQSWAHALFNLRQLTLQNGGAGVQAGIPRWEHNILYFLYDIENKKVKEMLRP